MACSVRSSTQKTTYCRCCAGIFAAAAHGTALLRQSGHVQYLAMEHYEPARDADELNWQALWKRFFHALTIEERRNAKAQMNHAPKRFWGGMVEMREPYI